MSVDGETDRSRKANSRKPDMHDRGESDGRIVPAKQPNNGPALRGQAEAVEERRPAKGNALEATTLRTQSRAGVSIGLQGVREVARRKKDVRFTALLHHVSTDLLRESYYALKRGAAPGVDGETWREYGLDLEARLKGVHGRVHSGAYRAKPSRRTYIPKADGRQRPLGVAALEDKIVQQAVVTILNQIYEQDFLGFSYGFRPGRNQHDALDALWVGIMRKKVNWVLDADIRGFFDTIDHDWMMKFLEHRIADGRVLRLIRKWLKAGILEEGKWSETEIGTPQGSVASPLLANIYLYYVLDLWVEHWRKKSARGDVIIVRYADDFVMGFEHRQEAERFLEALRDRMEKFGLSLHPEKTRLLEFGRFAAERRRERGENKPETFDFLGFTHICGKKLNGEGFIVKRRTVAKRLRVKLREVHDTLMNRRHEPPSVLGAWLRTVVQGYLNYHAVSGNMAALETFRREVCRSWLRALRRRGQRHRMPWTRFRRLIAYWLPPLTIRHPRPDVRFFATHPT